MPKPARDIHGIVQNLIADIPSLRIRIAERNMLNVRLIPRRFVLFKGNAAKKQKSLPKSTCNTHPES